jgi:hypothetical protein
MVVVGGCGGDMGHHRSRDRCLLLLKVWESVNCAPKVYERAMVMVNHIVVGGCGGGVGHHRSFYWCLLPLKV